MSTYARDLDSNMLDGQSFTPASRSATANGTGIDMSSGDGLVNALVNVGAFSGGSSPTLIVTIEESTDNSTFTSISGATSATYSSAGIEWLSFNRTKRYVRAVATIAGGPTGIVFTVSIHQQKKQV